MGRSPTPPAAAGADRGLGGQAPKEGVGDPTIIKTLTVFRSILKRKSPALGGEFRVPKADAIDGRLIAGAAIFGIGWGLAGFCPGPALVGVAAGLVDAWIFLPAMVAGSFVAGRLAR